MSLSISGFDNGHKGAFKVIPLNMEDSSSRQGSPAPLTMRSGDSILRQNSPAQASVLLARSLDYQGRQQVFRPHGQSGPKGSKTLHSIKHETTLNRQKGPRSRMRRSLVLASETGHVSVAGVNQDKTLWLRSASTLLVGALGTNLLLAASSQQVLSLEHWKIAGLLFATDCVFVGISYKFLQLADNFDRDWHKKRNRYPGPAWGVKEITRDSNQAQEPYLFPNYVQLFLVTGVAMPFAVTLYTFFTSDAGPIAAAVLPPYLLTLIVQVWQENNFIKTKSALWPIVPMHHMGYRFLQLARGSWVVSALQGPQYLLWVLTFLACLWVFNFGAVLTWQTSLYYWHRQPAFADKELQ